MRVDMLRVAVAGALALLLPAIAAAAPIFAISGPGAVRAGETLALNVNVSGAVDLYAWQFTVNFDRSLFRAVSVAEGPFLAAGGTTFFDRGTIDNSVGTISFVLDTLIGAGPGVNGSGVLGTLRFDVLGGAPSGTFSLGDVFALNSNLDDLGAQAVAYIQAVPEPGTLALLGAGLLVLARRQGARRSAAPPVAVPGGVSLAT